MKMHKMIEGKTYERVFYYLDPSESTVKGMMNYGKLNNIDFVKDVDGWWAYPHAFAPNAVEASIDKHRKRS